ncbi:low molecular weight phosphatase family protein [Rothia sp. ZJ932]|uniref:arsenate reductase/protein-tyrosine-phosphatase family protein n=1 Tax=Rothia sp. ZJ932 TaxID=2810516 RepID=UPI0019672BCB|nr:low molecular weight phosphatase family protein [Rothia sp. ZJ932]QRZ61217.1 low molecular weight phosphatase family protein [Rothia sp. ZJ932]
MSRFNVSALLKRRESPAAAGSPPADELNTILYVCTGNIARSASAQLISQHRSWNEGWVFDSAGIGAVVGSGVAPDIDHELLDRGIDISGYKAKQLTREIAESAALIVAMDHSHRKWIIREWPHLHHRVVLLKQIQRVRAEAGRRVEAISYLQQMDIPVRSSDDIADPYRLGVQAARTAVEEVEDGLDVLLPWLGFFER